MALRLAAQEHLLEGDTLVEKYEFARNHFIGDFDPTLTGAAAVHDLLRLR